MTLLPNPGDPRGPHGLCDPYDPYDLPGCTVLALPEEIDFSNAPGLLGHVMSAVDARAERLKVLVLDFTGTAFMDSQGVRLVEDVRRRVRAGVLIRVAAAPDGVASRVLELTGLRRDVPVYDNLAEALAS